MDDGKILRSHYQKLHAAGVITLRYNRQHWLKVLSSLIRIIDFDCCYPREHGEDSDRLIFMKSRGPDTRYPEADRDPLRASREIYSGTGWIALCGGETKETTDASNVEKDSKAHAE